MSGLFESVGRRALFRLDPETAHGLSVRALKTGLPLGGPIPRSTRLAARVAGLDVPNILGIAAGYDKHADVPDALLRLGFGFAEIGTVTPLPQPGNSRPRIFRLTADEAVINRLGFNSEGHTPVLRRLIARKGQPGVVGVNIGANKEAADRIADYEAGIRRFAPVVSYLTVNISSPNTPGLRTLQSRANLFELLERVRAARPTGSTTPVFLKIAPDLAEGDLDDIAEALAAHPLDGLIVSNTTLSREGLLSSHAKETGGLSGKPLFARSTAVLARMRQRAGPELPLIGAGGISSAETALEKVRAGADLLQLYSAFIYGGPRFPAKLLGEMDRRLERDGIGSISALRDTRVAHWAAQPI